VVAVWFAGLPEGERSGSVASPGKVTVTFSDALAAVRRRLWMRVVFPQFGGKSAVEKLPESLREVLLSALAPAA